MSSPTCGGEPRDRIDVGGVDPARAAVVGHAERLHVGDAAAARFGRGLDQHDAHARGDEPACGSDAGGAGADHDHFDIAGARNLRLGGRLLGGLLGTRRAQGRSRTDGGGSGEERASAYAFHGSVAARLLGAPPCRNHRLPANDLRRGRTTQVCALVRDPAGDLVPRGDRDYLCRRCPEETMLDAAVKALSQMFTPPFRTVLLEVRRACARADRADRDRAQSPAGLARRRRRGVGREPCSANGAQWSLSILAWILSIAATLGIVLGSIFLMPAVTALVASFFVDDIALEVERRHYPDEPVGTALPVGARRRRGSQDRVAGGAGLSPGGAVLAVCRRGRGHLLPRHRVPARPGIFRACRHALPAAGGSQAVPQGATRARCFSPAC